MPAVAAGALGTPLCWSATALAPLLARDATLVAVATIGFVVIVPVDYGAAMKLIVVAGMVTLPVAAWSMGKLGGLAYPGPGSMAVATIPFLFDRSFNIYGGNLLSTMAGEFANLLGLTFAVVFFGSPRAAWRPVGIGELLRLCLRLPDSPISSPPSSRSCVCWRCGSSGRVCARPLGSLSSAHWPACSAFWVLRSSGTGRCSTTWAGARSAGTSPHLGPQVHSATKRSSANDPPLQVLIVLAVIGAVLCGVRRVRFGMATTMVAVAFAACFFCCPRVDSGTCACCRTTTSRSTSWLRSRC